MDVNALDLTGAPDDTTATAWHIAAADNLKRVHRPATTEWSTAPGLDRMLAFLEIKTVWHPIGVRANGTGTGGRGMLPVSVAQRVVSRCLHLQAHERVLIVTDESPGHDFVMSLAAAARMAAADVVVMGAERVSAQPHGYLTWRPPGPVVTAAIRASDVAVFYASTLMALSDEVRAAAGSGTRMLFIPADFDLRRPVVLGEDLTELDSLGAAVTRLLQPATRLRVTSADGTDLHMNAGGAVTYDDCQIRAPGEIDFFPGGMWNLVPDLDSVTGVVRFTAALHRSAGSRRR